jgi:Fe-S cluster biogenesis protein NfuA
MDTAEAVNLALLEMLPAMVADGGGAEIVQVEDDWVALRLTGTCLFCPSRKRSAAALEDGLKRRVPTLRTVVIEYPKLERRTVSGLVTIRGSMANLVV